MPAPINPYEPPVELEQLPVSQPPRTWPRRWFWVILVIIDLMLMEVVLVDVLRSRFEISSFRTSLDMRVLLFWFTINFVGLYRVFVWWKKWKHNRTPSS